MPRKLKAHAAYRALAIKFRFVDGDRHSVCPVISQLESGLMRSSRPLSCATVFQRQPGSQSLTVALLMCNVISTLLA